MLMHTTLQPLRGCTPEMTGSTAAPDSVIEESIENSSFVAADGILSKAARARRSRRRIINGTVPQMERSSSSEALRHKNTRAPASSFAFRRKSADHLIDDTSALEEPSIGFLSREDSEYLEEPSNWESMTSLSQATDSTGQDEIISKKLLKYGIVPLEKKSIHAFKASRDTKNRVEEVHRWLFVEGGHYDSVEGLMTNYCRFVRELGIPVDRMFYGGLGLHPRLTAFLWKWTPEEFVFREMPPEVFERRFELFSPHEPFCILEKGEADYVRIRKSDIFIPPDTEKWFRGENYVDYFALPDIYRNESKGSLAWATKDENGFLDEQIAFFELTLPALTTVLRTHTNDLVLRTLTYQMEREIEDRTQELAEANQKLMRAMDQLAIQSQKQLEHFACMSHEIRTPLNCIVGISSLLLDSPETLSPEVTESIQMVNTSADLLAAVVNDVLDYSKMESGVFEVDVRPTNLQDTVNVVVHTMQEKAAKNAVRIVPSYGFNLPEIVKTDGRRLQQILYNLLGNACKFSKEGGTVDLDVRIDSHVISQQAGASHLLKLSIKDYGKGIAQDDFEAIFQPFNQAGKETATVYGGTGLGLSITSSLVDRLGGRITVDSKLGEYAQFVVELPFHDDPVVMVSEISESFSNTTIVTLYDDEAITTLLSPEVIETYALNVTTARNLEDFWNQRDFTQQHCILVIPVDDVDQVSISKIRNKVKTISVVTHGAGGNKCNSGLHWPSLEGIFPMTAMKGLSGLLAKEQSTLGSDVLGSEHGSITSHDPALDGDQAVSKISPRILIAEDNVVNQKVLVRVLKRLGVENVDVVDNGQKAIDACVATSYSLVFMDVQMPVLDGFEATRAIKARCFSHSPKVVFCTAHAVEDYRDMAFSVGGDGFVPKPFDLTKIGDCLKDQIGYTFCRS